MTDSSKADTGRALEGRSNFGVATGVVLKHLVRLLPHCAYQHRYTPHEEPDWNGRHQWLFRVGPIRFGVGWITPVLTPLDRVVFKRAPTRGCTLWLWRAGIGWRWER